ncbi:hypothetical protein JHK87_020667 [Glycine soja]|nr:hypothetical protein JHK87_020667 [Glycine soja]
MSVILPFVSIFLLHVLTATSETILQCLSLHSDPSRPISAVTYFPKNPSYPPILEAYIRNLRFSSPTTPKPTFIVAPTHVSHIQASIICCKRFNLEIRTRSGGHDFEGLSYMSQTPFVIVDMFMLKSVEVDVEDQTAWVDSGSTIGELYYAIAEKSRVLGFPAVPVPEVVTVFRIEKTLEQDASDLVFQWQYVADKIHDGLFIRVVLSPVTRSDRKTIKAKFNALFLGNSQELLSVMNQSFPQLGLVAEQCIQMSWIQSVLFWDNYPVGTSVDVLLQRHATKEKFLKKKSDYVQQPISKAALEGIWKMMMELEKPVFTFNPYGGKMGEISEFETPFPHRFGNIFKIQYSVSWDEEGEDVAKQYLYQIRRLYDYMTPYVSYSPRSSYLNYRDVDIGVNGPGNATYAQASVWGRKYFKRNFDRLVQVKTKVDPSNFFRYEQSIPSLASAHSIVSEKKKP